MTHNYLHVTHNGSKTCLQYSHEKIEGSGRAYKTLKAIAEASEIEGDSITAAAQVKKWYEERRTCFSAIRDFFAHLICLTTEYDKIQVLFNTIKKKQPEVKKPNVDLDGAFQNIIQGKVSTSSVTYKLNDTEKQQLSTRLFYHYIITKDVEKAYSFLLDEQSPKLLEPSIETASAINSLSQELATLIIKDSFVPEDKVLIEIMFLYYCHKESFSAAYNLYCQTKLKLISLKLELDYLMLGDKVLKKRDGSIFDLEFMQRLFNTEQHYQLHIEYRFSNGCNFEYPRGEVNRPLYFKLLKKYLSERLEQIQNVRSLIDQFNRFADELKESDQGEYRAFAASLKQFDKEPVPVQTPAPETKANASETSFDICLSFDRLEGAEILLRNKQVGENKRIELLEKYFYKGDVERIEFHYSQLSDNSKALYKERFELYLNECASNFVKNTDVLGPINKLESSPRLYNRILQIFFSENLKDGKYLIKNPRPDSGVNIVMYNGALHDFLLENLDKLTDSESISTLSKQFGTLGEILRRKHEHPLYPIYTLGNTQNKQSLLDLNPDLASYLEIVKRKDEFLYLSEQLKKKIKS
jgi:hypothetical protein